MAGKVVTVSALLLALAAQVTANRVSCQAEPVVVHLDRGQKVTVRYWVGEEPQHEFTDLPKLNRRTTTFPTLKLTPPTLTPYPYAVTVTNKPDIQDTNPTLNSEQQSTLGSSTVGDVQTNSITIIERQDITNEIDSPSSTIASETTVTTEVTPESTSTLSTVPPSSSESEIQSQTSPSSDQESQTLSSDSSPAQVSPSTQQSTSQLNELASASESNTELQNDVSVTQTTAESISSPVLPSNDGRDEVREVSFAASSIRSITVPIQITTSENAVDVEANDNVKVSSNAPNSTLAVSITDVATEQTTPDAERVTETPAEKQYSGSQTASSTITIEEQTTDEATATTTESAVTEPNETSLISTLSSLLTSLFSIQEASTSENIEETTKPDVPNDEPQSVTPEDLSLLGNEILTSQQPSQQGSTILENENEINSPSQDASETASDDRISTTTPQTNADTAATIEYVSNSDDLIKLLDEIDDGPIASSTVQDEDSVTETDNEILETSTFTREESPTEDATANIADNPDIDVNDEIVEEEEPKSSNSEVTETSSEHIQAATTSNDDKPIPVETSSVYSPTPTGFSISNEIQHSNSTLTTNRESSDIEISSTSAIPSLEPNDGTLMESILHRLLHDNSDNPIDIDPDEDDEEHEGEVGVEEPRANKEFAQLREDGGAEEGDVPLEENEDDQEEEGLEVGHHQADGIMQEDSFDGPATTQDHTASEAEPEIEESVDRLGPELQGDDNDKEDPFVVLPGIRRGPDLEPFVDVPAIAEHLLQPALRPPGPRVYHSSRNTREIRLPHPNATTCSWVFKTEPGVPLLLTLKNYSAPETERCTEHHIAVERSNGYEARWCGDTNDTFNHATFARHEIRLRYYTETEDLNNIQIPEGFVAEVQALDMNLLRKAVSKVRPLFKQSKT